MIAVLIDALSIQQYIFSSNKLREQIGASFIVEKLIFDTFIPRAIKEATGFEYNIEEWNNEDSDYYQLLAEQSAVAEIGYIGGGNAMVIFKEKEHADAFVKFHSLLLIQYFPGVKMAYAIGENFQYDGEGYKECRKLLSKALIRNRNLHTTVTMPFKPGIADDCNYSGEAMEDFTIRKIRDNGNAEPVYVSSVTYSKQNDVIINEARAHLTDRLLNDIEKKQYAFTDNMEELGQPEEKGYIAIVHADGNGMGQRFLEASSLAETRKLSRETKRYADAVMKALIQDVIQVLAIVKDLDTNINDEGKRILPIRPIIAGGDDITFVCEGRLGMYLAERLLKHMTEVKIADANIEACAGVVLVHSKFPFYKAYKLCEEVIKSAKKESRSSKKSWLNYHISSGGFSGSYEDILQQEFFVPGKGRLKFGPYVINDQQHKKSYDELKKLVKAFAKQWPRSKAKELRDVLRRSEADEKFFLTSLKVHKKNKEMNEALRGYETELWSHGETPFFDPIELLDFYPAELLTTNH